MMDLPEELEEQLAQEIKHFAEEKHMPYVTGLERIFIKRGLSKGL